MSWSQDVFSSTASTISYEEEGQRLLVRWKNGKTSVYSGVPEDLARQIADAPSVGQALNTSIKNQFSHSYE